MKCECGCEATVKPGNRFISGHNSRFIKRYPSQYVKVSAANSKSKTEIQCRTCGAIFFVPPNRKDKASYCSRACASKGSYPKAKARGFHTIGRVPANKGKHPGPKTLEKLRESHLGQRAWNAGTKDKLKARLNQALSSSVARTISRGAKQMRHWEHLVGWTVGEFKEHIASMFKDGMSWDNYGEWEIDHVIPRAAFNFNCPEDFDFKRCWDLCNLQPLWKSENRSKKANLTGPFQPGLKIAYYGYTKERNIQLPTGADKS